MAPTQPEDKKESVKIFESVWKDEQDFLKIDDPHDARGLALSGGGIRSASFGLGVIQALLEHRVMEKIDYLSTVSGGGYIGSALTRFRKIHPGSDPAKFFDDTNPFGVKGKGVRSRNNSIFLSFLRQHANYLNPTRYLDIISAISVALRNLLISLLIYSGILLFILSLLMIGEHYIAKAILFFFDLNEFAVQIAPYLDFESSGYPREKIFEALVKSITGDESRWLFHSFFHINILIAIFLIICFILYGLYFSISTFFTPYIDRLKPLFSYTNRRVFQAISGQLLKSIIFFFMLAALPIANVYFEDWLKTLIVGTIGTVSGAWAALSKFRTFLGKTILFRKAPWIGERLFGLGALLFLFAMAVVFYRISLNIYGIPSSANETLETSVRIYLFIFTGFALLLALFVNINYASLGRMYRDRLMETFLPDKEAVQNNSWRPATEANSERLEDMCKDDSSRIRKPFHIINTNVILTNSEQEKFRSRGGDSFILTPLYCGADSTDYIRTQAFMKSDYEGNTGMRLANAMATSGAAINPHTGVGGQGPTRGPLVSILMTMFNLRLGTWVPSPRKQNRWYPFMMNYIFPGFFTLLRMGYKETSRYLELSDGGHFENLGLYELIRRRVGTIIVSDAGVDKDFKFSDLANAIEKVRTDFGVSIRFSPEETKLRALLPGSAQKDNSTKRVKLLDDLAKSGYIVGKIIYPQAGDHAPFTGRIVLLKTTMIKNLPADLYSYRSKHPDFPDQPTSDQFFDEKQFEAYRELGYRVTDDMCIKYKAVLIGLNT